MLRYAITDRMRVSGDEHEREAKLLDHAASWTAAGIDFVQLREKDMAAGALADLGRRMLAIFRTYSVPPKLLINSRADVAVAIGADGVHLTSTPGELTPAQVGSLYMAAGLGKPVVSRSCHTVGEIAAARDSGATLMLFGPVFEKSAHDQLIAEGTGLNLLRTVCLAAAPIPVFALGGITPENSAACLAAGAAGIAAIRLFSEESTLFP